MDSILERLWALANSDDAVPFQSAGSASSSAHLKEELVAEAQALWRTLETLLATMRTQDLSVGDPAFVKLLSCIRTVLSDPEHWRVHAADKHEKGVYVYVNRVIVKLGCRGERERDAMVRDGLVELLVESMHHQCDSTIATGSMLQVLQTLAFDAKNRQALDATETLPFSLSLMKTHPRDVHVQVFGCKFLQLMVYEEECKEKMARYGAIHVVLDALRRFPNDPQLAVSALDLVYFSSMELESVVPTETQFLSMMEDVVESVIKTMRIHSQVAQVQTNGVAILNNFASHVQAKRMMCAKNVWELVLGALDFCGNGEVDDAAGDVIDFLEALLSDPITFDTVEYTLKAPSINERTKLGTIQTLKALKTKLEIMQNVEKKQSEVLYITGRLQSLTDPKQSSGVPEDVARPETNLLHLVSRLLPPPESDFGIHQQTSGATDQRYMTMEDDESEIPLVATAGKLHYSSTPGLTDTHASQVEGRSQLTNSASAPNSVFDDAYGDVRNLGGGGNIQMNNTCDIVDKSIQDMKLPECDSTRFLEDLAADSEVGGYFEKFLRDVDEKFKPSYQTNEQVNVTTDQPHPPVPPTKLAEERPAVSSITPVNEGMKHHSLSAEVPQRPHHVQQLQQQQQTRDVDATRSYNIKPGGMENSSQRQSRHPDGSSSSSSDTWRKLYESSVDKIKALKAEYHNLQENFKIVSRRAREQSKLLNLQTSRIKNHMEVHQQVLDQVRTLGEALADANRKYQVERELRTAEVAQSEKISMALHEATKEIKALSSQNSSASRELMHKEKLRVDYQQKTSEIKHLKEKIELERDDAVIQAQTIRFEKVELCRQLEDSRREGIEALLMREEDVNAPKPRVFSEIGRSSMSSPPRTMLNRGRSNPSFNGSQTGGSGSGADCLRRSSSCSPFAVQPIDTSASRSFSTYGGRSSPKKAGAFSSLENDANADPETIEREDIESSLRAIYGSMDTSLDGTGVHIATVRRFILECGIVQVPLVAADVDVILAKVLNQAQENRRKVVVRKDYAFAQAAPPPVFSQANEAKRFRYFDQDSFNEALTLVGMKRYPRFDVKRVLQTIVAEYLHPIQRRMRANSMLQACNGSANGNGATTMTGNSFSFTTGSMRRSSSIHSINGGTGGGNGSAPFCGSPRANSPSSVCSAVMRAILNGLALHIGHGNEQQRLPGAGGSGNDDDFRGHLALVADRSRRHTREEVVYSMLEMDSILAREQKPLGTICEFYSAIHHHHQSQSQAARDELLGISFELLLNFALDFEIIPSFMDRVSLKHLYSEVSGFIKSYLSLHKRFPHATDPETLKKVAFSMVLARVAIELFSAKVDYETPEKQITGLLQWLDNSNGREKIMRKAMLPIVIKFSRKLYALKT